MNAPLRHFQSADIDRRREPRLGFSADPPAAAVLSMAGKVPCPAPITDVSPYGCCVESAADWLRPGRVVGIALGDAPALQSIVRWIGNGYAGLELMRPIAPERADWLALIA